MVSKHPLQQQLERLAADRWSRAAVRTMLRAAWLSLSVWCIGLGLALLLGWELPRAWLAALALLLLAGGAASLVFQRRLPTSRVARRLDRRFRLNEQLSTALEVVSGHQPSGGVADRLVAEANRSAAQLRRRIEARTRPPWAEVVALLALALVLLGLTVLLSISRDTSGRTPQPLPGLVPPEEAAAPPPDEPLASEQPQPQPQQAPAAQSQPSPEGQAAAERLADALRDQAPTRSAAEALDQGNVGGAASELRELADQAGGLSQRSREALADQLRGAANDLQGIAPELAEQLQRSADGLEQGGQEASDALDDLASAVENLGQGQPQGQGGPQGQQGQQGQQGPGGSAGSGNGGQGQQQQAPSDRLGVEGVPLELDAAGEGDTITGNAESLPTGRSAGPAGQNSSRQQSDDVVQTGDDPLRIPADLRDVVQGYFSPEE